MTIYINGEKFDNVTELSAERRSRQTDIRYNTQGDMLIDMVSRKYHLSVTFARMTQSELKRLRELTGEIFTSITFPSPEGDITADFHTSYEPAPTVTMIDGQTIYGGIKLEFEER